MFVRAYFSLQMASHSGLLPLPELLMEIKKNPDKPERLDALEPPEVEPL